MKLYTRFFRFFFSFIFAISIAFSWAFAQPETEKLVSKDLAVLAHATVDKEAPSITLHWIHDKHARQYEIYRKNKDEDNWTSLRQLDSGTTSFTDTDVEIGEAYEYQILANSQIYVKVNDSTNAWMPYYATSYLYAGIDVPPPYLGKVLLIIEQELSEEIIDRTNRLITDLEREGWEVVWRNAPRTEEFDGEAVKNVKDIIMEEYENDPNNLTTVFLIGRVAVPYSGDFNNNSPIPPDAHRPNHNGAWPSDVYYGIMNDSYFTDISANNTQGGREANHNVPDDGKFDQSSIRGQEVNLRIGRLDLYNMLAFDESETELIKNYLDKDHAYRTGEVEYLEKGKIYDGFKSMQEAFSSSGWRAFASFFTGDSITSENWIKSEDSTTHLWAYGCAGGSYTGYGGANVNDFASANVNVVFTMLFGSYFGDWDHKNSFLRAPLASSPTALTCAWSGRPHWYLHHMNLGEPIGYSAVVSQTNKDTYLPNLYYNQQYGGWYIHAVSMQQIHSALMGDPTLRMNLETVPPISDLTINQSDDDRTEISWEAPESEDVKYYIYRGISPLENSMAQEQVPPEYELLNKTPLTETSYIDSTIVNGEVNYKVVAGKLKETIGGGSFYNPSPPITDKITITSVDYIPELDFDLTATPNPARRYAKIYLSLNANSNVNIGVYDVNGREIYSVCSKRLEAGEKNFVWNLTDATGKKVPAGIYFVKAFGKGEQKVVKIIVAP